MDLDVLWIGGGLVVCFVVVYVICQALIHEEDEIERESSDEKLGPPAA